MIVGIGIDILEIGKLKRIIKFGKNGFLNKVFTEKEIDYAKNKKGIENLATAFVAKEAVFKCLNLPVHFPVCFKEIEILRDKNGRPRMRLSGKLVKKFPEKEFRFFISMAYTEKLAVASAFLEKN
jgi:holo-[acyl-carrier-protein] synthase